MKRLSMLVILILSRTTFAEPTAARPPSPDVKSPEARIAAAAVGRVLLEPLARREHNTSKFSRASLGPQERRVRILDKQPRKDVVGAEFVRFAVDARHDFYAGASDDEATWGLATITGCVYLDDAEVFIERGGEYRPAAFLLGKNRKAAPKGVCEPEPGALSALGVRH
jgi:hypothetical protein